MTISKTAARRIASERVSPVTGSMGDYRFSVRDGYDVTVRRGWNLYKVQQWRQAAVVEEMLAQKYPDAERWWLSAAIENEQANGATIEDIVTALWDNPKAWE